MNPLRLGAIAAARTGQRLWAAPAAKKAFIGAFGGGGRRIFAGALIGAAYGGLTAETTSPTGRFGSVLGGALIGAGVGGLTTRTTGRAAWGLAKNAPVGLAATTGVGLARRGLNLGIGTMRFAYRNPRSALLLGGGVAAAYGAMSMGPGESGMNTAEMSAIAARHGGPSTGFDVGMGAAKRQNDRQMFIESTFGLTQGLHAGRHRG